MKIKSNIFNKIISNKKLYLSLRIKKHLGKLKNTAKIKAIRKIIAKKISIIHCNV